MIENSVIRETVDAKVRKMASLTNIAQGERLREKFMDELGSLKNDEFTYLIKRFIQIYIVNTYEGNAEDITFNNGMSIKEVRNEYASVSKDADTIEGIWDSLKLGRGVIRLEKYFFSCVEDEFKRRIENKNISTKETCVFDNESFKNYIKKARQNGGKTTVLDIFQDILELKGVYFYQYLNEVIHEDILVLDDSMRKIYKIINDSEKEKLQKDMYFQVGGGVKGSVRKRLLTLIENDFVSNNENQWVKEIMFGAAGFAKEDTNFIRKNNFILETYLKYLKNSADSSDNLVDSERMENHQSFIFDVLNNAINLPEAASKIVKIIEKADIDRIEIYVDTKELVQISILYTLSKGDKKMFKEFEYLKDLNTTQVLSLQEAIDIYDRNVDIYKDDVLSLNLKKNLKVMLSEIYKPIFVNVYSRAEQVLNQKNEPIVINRDYVVVEMCGNEGVEDTVKHFLKNALLNVNNPKFEKKILPLVDDYIMRKDVEKQNKDLPKANLRKF